MLLYNFLNLQKYYIYNFYNPLSDKNVNTHLLEKKQRGTVGVTLL